MEKHGSNKKHVGVFNSYNNCYLEITQMFVCTEDYVFSNYVILAIKRHVVVKLDYHLGRLMGHGLSYSFCLALE